MNTFTGIFIKTDETSNNADSEENLCNTGIYNGHYFYTKTTGIMKLF